MTEVSLHFGRFLGAEGVDSGASINKHEVSGFYSVKKEAEATPEQYADLRAAGRNVPDDKVAA